MHFHFIPTRASWLNQIERWFSLLPGQSLSGACFTSVKELRDHIDAFIDTYNDSQPLRLDEDGGPPKTPQKAFRSTLIPGTSTHFSS